MIARVRTYSSYRRPLLGAVAGLVGSSGCLSTGNDAGADTPTGPGTLTATEPADRAVLGFEAVTLEDEQRDRIEPIRFDELPDDEQSIVQEAMNADRYAVDAPGPEPLQEFTSRVNRHKSRQISAYREDHSGVDFPQYLDVVFLLRSEQLYAITLLVGDQVLSMADFLD